VKRHVRASSAGSNSSEDSFLGSIRRAFATRGASRGSAGSSASTRRRPTHGIAAICASLIATAAVFAGSAAPAVAAECANEQLRAENNSTALPDCRAYERVTPVFKNGGNLESFGFVADGPRVGIGGIGNFAGTPGSGFLGTNYESLRTGSAGWATTPLSAPASIFVGNNFEYPMYSLGTNGNALFGLRTRSQPVDAESLYLWQNGVLEEMGPEVPPASLIGEPEQEIPGDENGAYWGEVWGVSRDATHVVYQVRSPSVGGHDYLWPFDQTSDGEFNSVYEYASTGNTQPLLVAVTGGQGSNSLIGGCGAWLGSKFNQNIRYAVSADGSTVFVTVQGEDSLGGPCAGPVPAPAHTEIYARVDGEKASAHTVAISEPSAADCSACQTGSRLEATFQGASEDGSKVFFLTEQELLPGNPGLNLYEYDFDAPGGQRVTAVSHMASNAAAQVQGVTSVSQDGSHVYFVAGSVLTTAANGVGGTAQVGEDNLYVADTASGDVSFVATLAASDSGMWAPGARFRGVQTTPDGRFLFFGSNAQVTPDNTSTVSQLFRYDAASGELVRVSIGEGGFNDNGNTSTDPATIPIKFTISDGYSQIGPPQRAMSDDGSRVFFQSSNGLTPQAANHVPLPGFPEQFVRNIYEYRDGHVYLISNGLDLTAPSAGSQESSVKLMGTTSSGDDVFFTTANPLVPVDKDTAADVYDARVGGGFAIPSSSPCSGESCQGLVGAPPLSPGPATSSFSGPGNPKPHHKKHKKKHHKKKHKSHKSRSGSKHGGSK
jgi:hypothetical protein